MRFGRIADAITRGLTFWRRSIQARVVMSTMLLSALVVTVVGWFLLQQTRDGLVDARVDRVLAEAANETEDARARLAAVPGANDERSDEGRVGTECVSKGRSRWSQKHLKTKKHHTRNTSSISIDETQGI